LIHTALHQAHAECLRLKAVILADRRRDRGQMMNASQVHRILLYAACYQVCTLVTGFSRASISARRGSWLHVSIWLGARMGTQPSGGRPYFRSIERVAARLPMQINFRASLP
jgi:hypothetical protein